MLYLLVIVACITASAAQQGCYLESRNGSCLVFYGHQRRDECYQLRFNLTQAHTKVIGGSIEETCHFTVPLPCAQIHMEACSRDVADAAVAGSPAAPMIALLTMLHDWKLSQETALLKVDAHQ